ncbi:uncharacterized protein N7469_000794 [Penicillium citrinum]|jgi:hypothetical protein|uniref:MARVEL domain-containing protein n=1 Tax=Penicillium citrinum TaxID=5077 RepID=A0A9W9TV05_PENCI|nr:uncharacterized protein N7469_000794 [Penicillium citrinum]KAJ5242467.1 hypothetical protein N7469_000794 [Penicillium citrinum]
MSISGDSHNGSPQTYDPVVPADLTRGSYHSAMGPPPQHTTKETRSSSESSGASLKSPRTARFAEATTIHSPIEPNKSPFADPQNKKSDGGVGDLGFGYVSANDPAKHADDSMPPVSPWRADMKVPNTARSLNPLSPTFREEYMLEKQEKITEKENARDLRIKLRVRIAKIFLRFINFGCSLIVLCLLAVTLTVFRATRTLPTRNGLPAWAEGTNPWAQYMLLAMACVSLFACLLVFYAYWKGGHHRAEKAAIYYTVFSIFFFLFSLIMWVVGAAIYQHSKSTGNSKDMWGWSCAQNTREEIYHDVIDYALLCRLQDWGLVCAIIEVVIELLAIIIYAVVLYRIWTKRRLMKTMNGRDQARDDLYLAQLRLQSAPNTPGFAGFSSNPPKSPFAYAAQVDPYSAAEKGQAPRSPTTTQYASPRSPTRPVPSFQLQPPPIRVQQPTPKTTQGEFSAPSQTPSPPPQSAPQHVAAAPGETEYAAVPIPGGYSSPMGPTFPAAVHQ